MILSKARAVVIGLFVAASLVPRETSAQIIDGVYTLIQNAPERTAPIGTVVVPARARDSTSYVEHWLLQDSGPLLRPGNTSEIRPFDAAEAEPSLSEVTAAGAGARWDAWSEEETIDGSLSQVALLSAFAAPEVNVRIAEIL